MKNSVKKEVEKLIKICNLNCSIEEFKDKVNWYDISASQQLSENFIREFQNKVNWYFISYKQELSLDFIREFKDYLNKDLILKYQKSVRDLIFPAKE